MRILGIDPGLTTVGIGLIDVQGPEEYTAVDWLTIETDPGENPPTRLAEIAKDLRGLLKTMQPELAVVEQLFFARNEKTAISVAQARGVILLALAERDIPIVEPTPMQMKSAITGDGGADKKQIGDMLMRWLKLDAVPTPADAADALGLALYGAFLAKDPMKNGVLGVQRGQ